MNKYIFGISNNEFTVFEHFSVKSVEINEERLFKTRALFPLEGLLL
jgi:hypothetical protein